MDTTAVAGVWNREWEEDPLGATDTRDVTTLVWWIQSGAGVYIDLRLPLQSPGRHEVARDGLVADPMALVAIKASDRLHAFVDNNPALLDYLLNQKSFAGVLNLSDGDTTASGDAIKLDKELADGPGDLCTCLWHRHIDFQPPTGGVDLGVCRREAASKVDGSVFIRETGDDGSYAEGWRKFGGSIEPRRALTLISENGQVGLRKGFWVRVGSMFGYVVGRPDSEDAAKVLGCHSSSSSVASAVGKTLGDTLQHFGIREKLDVAMSYVVVAGRIDGEGKWSVQYSTNPELVGTFLPEGVMSDDGQQVTQSIGSTIRQWRVIE